MCFSPDCHYGKWLITLNVEQLRSVSRSTCSGEEVHCLGNTEGTGTQLACLVHVNFPFIEINMAVFTVLWLHSREALDPLSGGEKKSAGKPGTFFSAGVDMAS